MTEREDRCQFEPLETIRRSCCLRASSGGDDFRSAQAGSHDVGGPHCGHTGNSVVLRAMSDPDSLVTAAKEAVLGGSPDASQSEGAEQVGDCQESKRLFALALTGDGGEEKLPDLSQEIVAELTASGGGVAGVGAEGALPSSFVEVHYTPILTFGMTGGWRLPGCLG